MVVVVLSCAQHKVIHGDVGGECDNGDAKAWEKVAEHDTVGENRALAPGLALGPRISEQGQIGHVYCSQ